MESNQSGTAHLRAYSTYHDPTSFGFRAETAAWAVANVLLNYETPPREQLFELLSMEISKPKSQVEKVLSILRKRGVTVRYTRNGYRVTFIDRTKSEISRHSDL